VHTLRCGGLDLRLHFSLTLVTVWQCYVYGSMVCSQTVSVRAGGMSVVFLMIAFQQVRTNGDTIAIVASRRVGLVGYCQ
jgi:hypothetical protein